MISGDLLVGEPCHMTGCFFKPCLIQTFWRMARTTSQQHTQTNKSINNTESKKVIDKCLNHWPVLELKWWDLWLSGFGNRMMPMFPSSTFLKWFRNNLWSRTNSTLTSSATICIIIVIILIVFSQKQLFFKRVSIWRQHFFSRYLHTKKQMKEKGKSQRGVEMSTATRRALICQYKCRNLEHIYITKLCLSSDATDFGK